MRYFRLLTAAAAMMTVCPAAFAQPAAPAPAAPAAAAPAAAAPPSAPAAPVPPSPNVVPAGDIIATLKASGHFTIFLKAAAAAQLTQVLQQTPNITLFAPTDEAFQALPAGQLDQLLLPKNAPTLQKVLIYHLINLSLDSGKIRGAKGAVRTVENTEVQIDGSGQTMMVNNADIIQPDVRATNGLIHVVDKVLIPSDVTLAAAAAAPPPATGG